MRVVLGRSALRLLIAAALLLAYESAASEEFREFSGKVTEISADKMVIDNRRGDRVAFRLSEATEVTGAKRSWQAIERGDRVTVSWQMVDNPRIAHKVVVMPQRQESNK